MRLSFIFLFIALVQVSASSSNKLIMLTPKEVLQQINIKGTVTDSQGDPLPGVSVFIKGTSQGTATDVNGVYTLQVPNESAILVFSFIGFINQELVVGNKRTIDVSMIDDVQQMEEVVVVGYGTQKKVNLSGSVDFISGDILQNRSTANVAELVKGASPNLNISMGRMGGEPGASSNWNVRGIGSINADAAPLILVDGVPVNINNIDPESIESVSVLKDASASAIYGSRAPFGVVLITTKKGQQGKARIEYSNNLFINYPQPLASFVRSLEWATAYNQASANANAAATYSDEQMARIEGYLNGTYPYEYNPDVPITTVFLGRRVGNANYDWPQELVAPSFNHKHNISISGGSEKINYFFSGGLFDQDGIYRYGYDNYKRYNLLSNLNARITDWLNVRTSIKYAKALSDYPVGQTTVSRVHIFGEALTFAPMMPKYNINGTIACPLIRWQEDSGRTKTESNDFFAGLGLDLEPVKGWVTSFTYNHNLINSRLYDNPKPVWVEMSDGTFSNIGKPEASWTAEYGQTNYAMLNVVSSYETTLRGHYLKALAGYEQEERKASSLSGTGTGLISNDVPSLYTALGNKTVSDAMNHWATQGIFGRLNYNYKEKYLFEFSARYNGSSRFSPESRWGFFPSASVAYAISKENFWTPVQDIVNNFKIRGSYGSLGNQNVSSMYSYLEMMGMGAELDWIMGSARPQYTTPPGIVTSDLTWETITTLNLGLDAAFLNNRLQVNFDWYDRVTKDMMGPVEALPYQLGVSAPQKNNAEMSNKGFELVLSWRDRLSNNFSYNAKFSLGDSRATITKYYNVNELINTWYPGKEYGEIWGYTTDGLIQEVGEAMPDQSLFYANWRPGDMKYKDLDGDGKVTSGSSTLKDHGDLRRIGNTTARYNYSITAGCEWKGFDFYMFWQGIGKRDYAPANSDFLFYGIVTAFGGSGIYKNTEILNYWRPADETNLLGPNTDAYFAKPYFSSETNKNRQIQTKYILDASYVRLKNIQLGYTVPSHISQKIFVQRARIYVSGENLITFTKLPSTFDPETTIASNTVYETSGHGRIYPLSKVLSFGVNITF